MNQLNKDPNFKHQDQRTQNGLFVQQIENNPWKDLLFLAKKGIVTAEHVRKKYSSPTRFIYNYEKAFPPDNNR